MKQHIQNNKYIYLLIFFLFAAKIIFYIEYNSFSEAPDSWAFNHFVTELKENWMCSTEYGYTFASAIQKNKIIATQFHPEKSQDKGLRFLSNFFSM